jgi:hypothetical protein
MSSETLYALLNVRQDADQAAIAALGEGLPPAGETADDPEATLRLLRRRAALRVLGNTSTRREYDESLRLIEAQQRAAKPARTRSSKSKKKKKAAAPPPRTDNRANIRLLERHRDEIIRHACWQELDALAAELDAPEAKQALRDRLSALWYEDERDVLTAPKLPPEPQVRVKEAAEPLDLSLEGWLARRERARQAVDRICSGESLPEPDLDHPPPPLTVDDPAELKRLVVAAAICEGEYPLYRQYSSSPLFTKLDFWRGEVPADLLETTAFREALATAEAHFHEPGAVDVRLLEEIGFRALELGKHHFAHYAFRELGILPAMELLFRDLLYGYLGAGHPRHAAQAGILAADLTNPNGPEFQHLGERLHQRCPAEPESCPAERGREELQSLAVATLLGEHRWCQEVPRIIAGQRRELLAQLAQLRDENLPAFREQFTAAVELFRQRPPATEPTPSPGEPDLEDEEDFDEDETEEREAPSFGLELARTLLGYRLLVDEFWIYFRQLTLEHPIAAFLVCNRVMDGKIWLQPVLVDGRDRWEDLLGKPASS